MSSPTVASLSEPFPLTYPIPTPTNDEVLLGPGDVHQEEDLLRNPFSFRHWWTTIQAAKDAARATQRAETAPADTGATLLGPLASPAARTALRRLTYLYEGALTQFPSSFKLWKSYLNMRMSYVLGKLMVKKKSGGRKKFPEMKDALVEEKAELEEWQGGLDGIVGWEEWKALVATFERALMWIPNVRPGVLFLRVMSTETLITDAPTVAYVLIHLQPPRVSTSHCTLPRPAYIRPRAAHASTFPALARLGALPPVGRG